MELVRNFKIFFAPWAVMADVDACCTQEEVTINLLAHLHRVIGSVALGPVVKNGRMSDEKLQKPR